MEFNKLSDLYKYLDGTLKSTLKNEFKDYAIEVMNAKMQHHVYDVGSPKRYERMYEDGGLLGSIGDRQNGGNSNFIEIGSLPYNMKSHYSLKPYYEPHNYTEFLNETVVYGKSGSYCGNGYWRKPRDYVTPSRNEIYRHANDKMIEFMDNKGIKLTH